MRRKDKQVNKTSELFGIIKQSLVCRIGLAMNNQPYIVPVSFGFDGKAIYFHTAAESGMKDRFLAVNKQVCFEFETGVEVIPDNDKPCGWSFAYQSVVGFGLAEELESDQEKIDGLQLIMAQYSTRQWDFSDIPMTAIKVWRIVINSMTGKQSPPGTY